MNKLLLATHNQAKLKELKSGIKELDNHGIQILSLDDLRLDKEPDETGITFRENAFIKAKFYGDIAGLPTIADDGGLTIPYLNNEPGIKSRRWIGKDASDEERINYTLKRLAGTAQSDRAAYLNVALCFYDPETNKIIYEEDKIAGHIAAVASPRRIAGYPYRALFIVEKFGKYYDDLTEDEHRQINHRLKALKRLVKNIKPFLLK